MRKHSRLVCNEKDLFTCSRCGAMTSSGYQVIDENETSFLCRSCHTSVRHLYPVLGRPIKKLLSFDVVLSDSYDPNSEEERSNVAASESASESTARSDADDYLGVLVPDGNGGWRIPTAEEIARMEADSAPAPSPARTPAPERVTTPDGYAPMEIKYKFTTDNRLLVILPQKCVIDGTEYVINVTTDQ